MVADSKPQAIVLSGSGTNAAYEVGVMKALLRGEWGKDKNPPIEPNCYSGTSVGAVNAAVMVANADRGSAEAVGMLEDVWTNRIPGRHGTNGVFRMRPMQVLDPNAYQNPWHMMTQTGGDLLHVTREITRRVTFAAVSGKTPVDAAISMIDFNQFVDLAPLDDLLTAVVDTGKIVLSPIKLCVSAMNWEAGSLRTFRNEDFDGAQGHDAIKGAIAIPGVIAPTSVDGYPFVDGAVLMSTPLKPAIDANGDSPDEDLVIHMSYLDTGRADTGSPPTPYTFATVYRLYMLALSRAIKADLARAEVVNERLRTRQLFETIADTDGDDDLFMTISKRVSPEAARFWRQLTRDTEDKKRLTVHLYRPTRHIRGYEVSQFNRDKIELLIHAGYDDAIKHDCEKEGCILPRE